jgi:hypothetical protein
MSLQSLRRTALSRVFAHSAADETSVRATMADLGLEHPERQPYIPSAWWVLRWLVPTSQVTAGDVFVEFGCGKGRIVLDAARRYSFARVVGVELSHELSAVAHRLVDDERARLRCPDVSIETADATRFAIPDTMSHAYLFNPFNGETFGGVLANIGASLDRAPRRLRMIYVNPVEHDAVMATGRFRVKRMVHTTRLVSKVRAGIYETV